MKDVFPADTKFISIVREPLSHFESTYHFFYKNRPEKTRDVSCWGMPYYSVCGWQCDLRTYLQKAPDLLTPEDPWSGRGKNFQAFEFGLDPWNETDEYIGYGFSSLIKNFLTIIS